MPRSLASAVHGTKVGTSYVMLGREPRTSFAALVEETDELGLTDLDEGNFGNM